MLCPQCGRENPPEGAPGATCGCGTGVAGAGPLEPWASTEVSDNVDGTRSQTNQARSWDETADTAFVGRHREMDVLKSALEDVLSGRGRLVMLSGELGIGKTRTAQELAAQAETRGARVLWGRCYEDFGAPPYWPWVQLLRSYIQLQDPQRLQVEMGPGAADIAGIIPELRSKLPHLEPPPVLEPEQARFRLFDAIATLLGNAALSQALVLVIDDLHWSDRSSLLLLEFIARELAGSPLLLLGTYRNVELSRSHPLAQSLGDLVKEPSFRRVALQGLSRQEVGLLVESAGVSPQGDLVDAVQARTEGNPFFVSEVVRLLQQEGLETGQTWDLRIPEGVRDAIGRRLSRLSGPCRQVLTLASVAGREFDFRLLEKLQVSTEDDFLEVLEEALGAHLIGEVPRSVGRYQFSHGLVQETLLGELSTARRLRLHARIGEALEELYGANAEAHAAELSYHFGQAEMTTGNQKSAHYSFLAGEQALSAYAWEEALRYFRQALAAKEGQPMDTQTASILFGLGRAQEVTLGRFEFQEYIPNMRRAFEYYAETGQVAPAVAVAEYPVRVVPGVPVGWAGLIGRALELVPPGSQLDARLQSTYGNALYVETGDYNGAREAFGRALTIARRERDAALEMRTLASAARVDFLHLRFQESMEEALRVIDLARSLDDLSCEVAARITLGWQMWCGGGGEMTTRNARELRSLADRLGNRTGLIEALEQGGRLCCLKGDWSGAREFFDRGLTLAPQDPRLLCSRAMLEYETGNFDLGGEYHRAILDQMGSAIMGLQFP